MSQLLQLCRKQPQGQVGLGAGKASPNFDLGTIGNIISGLVGGGLLGQIVTLALPSVVVAAETGHLSVGGIISQIIAGGAGGPYSRRSLVQLRTELLPDSPSLVGGPGWTFEASRLEGDRNA